MGFIKGIFNKKTQDVINDYKNKTPEDIQYIDSYIDIIKLALVKNNITTVELFYSFGGGELFDKIKGENSSSNILVLYKGDIDNLIAKNGYTSVYHSKRGNYSLVIFQHQFIYEELFGVELWNDGSSTPEKIHAFNCYITEKINYFAGMNCEVMGIGVGNINKKQYENLMEDYHKEVKTPKIKANPGKVAIYTGIVSTIGAGLLIGLKILSKKDKK
ncbi:hypothetical protein [Clostridium estertheticum]|uniref:hypothetical protein n=1 Tax=Clostridium estertheticum TaxID=238834 RepID=UPI001C7D2B61|nr:hypothetical protein [Clostridium estertheticum]MBX4267468.1 hypothetical protein [Clostridium estertheticum]MBX4271825.1 hypothetical protein [Clostridium estertheticum]WLC80767.1 hypothetical protein KTC98_05650 [Clostridium estertheticum]WLC87833.1 hypothetical protein KTC95_17360 [Clostridium estertheticum]